MKDYEDIFVDDIIDGDNAVNGSNGDEGASGASDPLKKLKTKNLNRDIRYVRMDYDDLYNVYAHDQRGKKAMLNVISNCAKRIKLQDCPLDEVLLSKPILSMTDIVEAQGCLYLLNPSNYIDERTSLFLARDMDNIITINEKTFLEQSNPEIHAIIREMKEKIYHRYEAQGFDMTVYNSILEQNFIFMSNHTKKETYGELGRRQEEHDVKNKVQSKTMINDDSRHVLVDNGEKETTYLNRRIVADIYNLSDVVVWELLKTTSWHDTLHIRMRYVDEEWKQWSDIYKTHEDRMNAWRNYAHAQKPIDLTRTYPSAKAIVIVHDDGIVREFPSSVSAAQYYDIDFSALCKSAKTASHRSKKLNARIYYKKDCPSEYLNLLNTQKS